jgi:hypothetical protein
VVTSKRFTVTLAELRGSWTILDLFEANCILDSFEDAETRARIGVD